MSAPNSIRDCMRSNPLTISNEASLVQAIDMIVDNKLTGITVTDEEGKAVGTLSELDCIKSVLTSLYNDGDPAHALVKDAMMSIDINSCSPSEGIVEVAQSMLDTGVRRRAVVEDGQLVGQVSSSNILWALMKHSRSRQYHGK